MLQKKLLSYNFELSSEKSLENSGISQEVSCVVRDKNPHRWKGVWVILNWRKDVWGYLKLLKGGVYYFKLVKGCVGLF